MPDSPSPFDDPFADLFGKLPDPRARERKPADGDSTTSGPSRPQSAPAAPSSTPPLSRRAAREAATISPVPADSPAAPVAATPDVPVTVTPSAYEPVPAPVRPQPVDTEPTREPVRSVATATLDDLFAGNHTTDTLGEHSPPKNKRKRRIGGWIALGVVLLLLGGVAAGGLWVWNTYEDKIRAFMGWEEPKDYEAGMATGEAFVTVVPGDTGSSISQTLFDDGVTKTPDAFYAYLIETAQNPPFVPGVFKMQQQMTSEAALAALLDPANKMENTAQLREGLTVAQSLPILAEGTGLPIEDFQAAVTDPTIYGVPLDPAVAAAGGQPLEGWLFPATYTFDPGVTAQDVIRTLVNRAVQSLDTAGVPVEDRQRILTIASIIQREARYEADMQKVSTVIVNRMKPDNQDTFGLLQMDSTAQYGYGEMHDGTVSSSAEALADPNPWNTYVNTGLPVGPISNPGDTAINAAMHPAEGDWMYFVTVNLNTGETVFTTNLADHNKAVAQWQAWCSDNPDAGC
jgi:UPF0755 protein